jgi:AcrR family transcriptional regulator
MVWLAQAALEEGVDALGEGQTGVRREARRAKILKVAREAFLEDGYAGTSMATISGRLGGSKGTLYAYFRSKEELFVAVVEELTDRHGSAIRSRITAGEAPETVLTAVGRQVLQVVTSEEPLKLQRLVAAEAERFPELGRALYERGPKLCHGPLSSYLKGAVEVARLRPHDTELAAWQFISLCRARSLEPTIWNLRPPLNPDEIERHVAEAVATFIAAYGSC